MDKCDLQMRIDDVARYYEAMQERLPGLEADSVARLVSAMWLGEASWAAVKDIDHQIALGIRKALFGSEAPNDASIKDVSFYGG